MKWRLPSWVKIYEALGAVADGRVHVSGNEAKVYSSSGNKYYDIKYDRETKSIMSNDNGSFYKGYLGYPAVAFLMMISEIEYSKELAEKLKGIPWKDLNTKFKNKFEEAIEYVTKDMTPEEKISLRKEADRIVAKLRELDLDMLGPKVKPPDGY